MIDRKDQVPHQEVVTVMAADQVVAEVAAEVVIVFHDVHHRAIDHRRVIVHLKDLISEMTKEMIKEMIEAAKHVTTTNVAASADRIIHHVRILEVQDPNKVSGIFADQNAMIAMLTAADQAAAIVIQDQEILRVRDDHLVSKDQRKMQVERDLNQVRI